MEEPKVLVIGLDGAALELIDPWIREGALPRLKRVKEEGIWGDLEVCLPPVTAPNWKCYSTGKNPGKLGVFWWESIDWENRKVYCPDYRSDSKEIWDYLNEGGFRAAVVNMPLTYPPKEIDGYLVAGGPDAGNEDFFFPPDLAEKLKEVGYQVRTSKSISSKEDCEEFYEETIDLIESRFRLVKNLLKEDKELKFIHLTVFYVNVLQHFLWNDEFTKRAWKVIDKNLGELMERCRKDGFDLIIISDHGSNEIKDVFNINTWLEKEGFLKIRGKSILGALRKIGLTRSRMVKMAEALRVKNLLKKILPSSLSGLVPSKSGGIRREAKGCLIDWENSTAVASGQGPLYVNREKASQDYEKFRDELIEKLENLKSPRTGRKIIRKVYKKEEIYSGKYLGKAPDLIIDQAPHVHIPGEIGKEEVFGEPGKWIGENKKTGLFAATGPDIKKGGKVKDMSILDIAPTILHLYGLPIPKDMDGKVLKGIFSEKSLPAKRKISYVEEEKEKIKSRIFELKKFGKI